MRPAPRHGADHALTFRAPIVAFSALFRGEHKPVTIQSRSRGQPPMLVGLLAQFWSQQNRGSVTEKKSRHGDAHQRSEARNIDVE
jgi:hypothetical protein